MRILLPVILVLVPSSAVAGADFEREVNGRLRAYEACAREASAAAPQVCAGHLAAARQAMTRLGYSAGQAESHVSLTRDRVIGPRVRVHLDRAAAPASPGTEPRAGRRAKAAPVTEASAVSDHVAAWTLCLEKARGDVLAYTLAADLDVAGTASAIVRACHGYEGTARDLHLAAGRSASEAEEAVRAVAERARAAAAAEIARRLARAAPARTAAR